MPLRYRSRKTTLNGSDYVTSYMYDTERPKPIGKPLGWNYLQSADASGNMCVYDNKIKRLVCHSAAPHIDFVYTGAPLSIKQIVSYADISFDFMKNNDFEIIPFIWELDETLATFSLDFIKNFSYGAYNWGVNPLIMDLKGLYSTVMDLFGGINLPRAIDEFNRGVKVFDINLPYPFSINRKSVSFIRGSVNSGNLKLKTYGGISTHLPDLNDTQMALAIFLDEIGFHPDLSTIWSLVPLSFVLDYFFPAAEYIDMLHPRGWFTPKYYVNGSFVISGNLNVVLEKNALSSFWTKLPPQKVKYKYRSERGGLDSILTGQTPPITWKAPSLLQVFNTAYIGGLTPLR